MAPWTNKTGLAKVTAILATVLLVSLGLCGANFFAVIRFVPLGGPGPQPGVPEPSPWPEYILTATAYLELAGIFGSIIGLAVVSAIGASRSFTREGSEPQRLFDSEKKD